jgi:NAD(P)-dependent dehydrogenase (short-subunit alcohol dehydrogenase family)
MSDWLGLKGKVVVISGAGGGLGAEMARAFAAAGAATVLLERDLPRAEAVAEEVRGQGGRSLALGCDTSDAASIEQAAAQATTAVGPVDALINTAAILRPGALDTLSVADWNAQIAVNLTGYLLCAQAFGRAMLARGGGALVHVTSIAASEPQPFSGAYSVTKAGVAMLSRQLAYEWGPRGVRSNALAPGLVRTPMSEAFYQAPGVAERRAGMTPLRRVAQPKDMADVALWLSSERSAYVTGQEIVVDGGLAQTLMGLVPRPGFAG